MKEKDEKAYIFFVLMAIIQLSNAQTLPVPDSVVTIFTKLPFTQSPDGLRPLFTMKLQL
jgi:hypothetical protein